MSEIFKIVMFLKWQVKDLKFDRDAIKADILEHVLDKDFQTKITAYTLKCLDEAGTDSYFFK